MSSEVAPPMTPEVAAAEFPLALDHVLRRMRTVHGASEVVTLRDDAGGLARATFADVADRADRLAAALRRLGVRPGDRVGSLAWNTQEHLEAYYAVPCLGAVLHTMNLRLTAEQIAYTVNHARDRVILVDTSLVEQMQQIAPLLETVEHYVVMGGGDHGGLPGAVAYEDLLDAEEPGFAWPQLDERTPAALCYTSGTTGDPKGVAYSHRTLAVHALAMTGFDVFRLAERDRALAVVPMFHAMAWNLPYVCGLVGADLVLPNRFLQAPHLARLIAGERVTYTSGVPTIFMDLLRHVAQTGADIGTLETIVCGGTQVPPNLMREYERRHGVKVIQGWGMTEVLPGAAMSFDPPGAGDEERWRHREMAGRVSPFYELRVVAPDGTVLPADGESTGEFEIRGPMVAPAYYGDPVGSQEKFHDGWLRTGDVGSLTADGWMRITDRAKDVIKSGGEWISSVDLESALMAHPAVDEAAVIARPDERWSERPLACVSLSGEASIEELRGFLAERVAKWWLPDEFAFLDEVPKTSVGKFDKKVLRDQLAAGALPVERAARG
jgi:fatty-acyl-CoA synthase